MQDLPVAHSWRHAFRLAEERGYEAEIKLPKRNAPHLPQRFGESVLSLPKGAEQVYRDQRGTDSFQVREYDDYWTIDLDRYNPERGYPIRHAVEDAPKQTALASVVIGGMVAGSLFS